jgi:hypothetical protein
MQLARGYEKAIHGHKRLPRFYGKLARTREKLAYENAPRYIEKRKTIYQYYQ